MLLQRSAPATQSVAAPVPEVRDAAAPARTGPAILTGWRGAGVGYRRHSGLVDNDRSYHAWMDRAHVAIGAGPVEPERKALAGIQSPRAEQTAVADHRVRLVVLICPGDGRADADSQCSGCEHEISRHHDGGRSGAVRG